MPFALFLCAAALPRVQDPLPDEIGLGFPFALAGAGGVLAGIAHIGSSPARRDRVAGVGGLMGFGIGVAVYLVALLNQLGLKP